jgi:glycosyltransferase involved in cell wall biosynthesis
MTAQGLRGLRVGLIGPLPPPSGGMANQTQQLSELLTAVGAKVTTVQVNAPYRPMWVGNVPVFRSIFRLLPYLVNLWRAAGHVDIFHVMANSGWSWHLFAAPAVWIARSRSVPAVVHYHGGEAAEFLQRAESKVRFTMRQARGLIVPSGFLQDVFANFGMPASIAPNIIDLERFSPLHPVLTGAPHLIVARNLEPIYDNMTAIRAFQVVLATFPQATLTIAGSGPEESQLRQFVKEQQLNDVVRFTGRLERDAMAALYRSADIALNPSLADNMPISMLEAWASGVPVVSTNVGGIPHLAQHGVNATLVAPENPVAMARACITLLSDAALWQQRAQAGLQEAQRYTWNQVQPVLCDVYRRAVAQPAR